jgi:hypothetical protein
VGFPLGAAGATGEEFGHTAVASVLGLRSRKYIYGKTAAMKMAIPTIAISRDEILWLSRREMVGFATDELIDGSVSTARIGHGAGFTAVTALSRSRIRAITGGHATLSSSDS